MTKQLIFELEGGLGQKEEQIVIVYVSVSYQWSPHIETLNSNTHTQ